MAFTVFQDPYQGAVFVICVIAIPLTASATLVRLIHGGRAVSQINLEDWFALVALVSFLFHAAIALWNVIVLNGEQRFSNAAIPPWRLVQLSVVGYVQQLNFPINPAFAKLSLLALYFKIFSINRNFRRWVWSLVILQVLWLLAVLLTRILFCIPIQKLWYPDTPGTCINPSLFLAAGESVNAAIALAMVVLSMIMVRPLAMSEGTKWKLRILFVLGGLTSVIDVIIIVQAYGKIEQNLTYLLLLTIQMVVNNLCCCAPVYRSIIPPIPWLQRLGSKVALWGYWSLKQLSKVTNRPFQLLSQLVALERRQLVSNKTGFIWTL
ncbi:hypothetical protein F4808DRAFT_194566 [Astrocystis sublimbata]|nr:hypothetical protein F4808DRAFT_194566 [Astrocystis sublimbata]